MDGSTSQKTPLYVRHVEMGARMTDFAGFSMPLQYSRIVEEHLAVRNLAGLFDVSHMGEVFVQGPRAFAFVQNLVTNNVAKLEDGKALYTVMCRPAGGIIDDLLVYRLREDTFILVINASNIEKVILSRTGYTGEIGLEIYVEAESALRVWDAILDAGADAGLKPCGLGARDTLRLEAGFCLYGRDLDELTNPYEARLGWLTKLDKGPFIGRDALRTIKEQGTRRILVGFVMEGRGIPRSGHPLETTTGEEIGIVTSGSQSPILQRGIGLGYVQNDKDLRTPGASIQVRVRNRAIPARIVKPPFHKS